MEILLLEGSCTDSFDPGPSTKVADWKKPRSYVREIHLLTLRHLAKSKNLKWLQGQRHWWFQYLAFSSTLLKLAKVLSPSAWLCQYIWMQVLHSNLLALVRKHTGPPCSSESYHLTRWTSVPPICALSWPPLDLSAPHPSEKFPQPMPGRWVCTAHTGHDPWLSDLVARVHYFLGPMGLEPSKIQGEWQPRKIQLTK